MRGKIAIAAAVAALMVLCLVPAVDAESYISSNPSTTNAIEFSTGDGGDITFEVYSDTAFTMEIRVSNGSTVLTETEYQIQRTGTNTVSVHVDGLGEGTYTLTVTLDNLPSSWSGATSFNVTVNVEKGLLDSWSTYLIIAVVVIVIVVFAYMKMRDTPKNKPEMTFEELEAQKQAEKAAKAEKKKSTGLTEREKYLEEKRRKQKEEEEE